MFVPSWIETLILVALVGVIVWLIRLSPLHFSALPQAIKEGLLLWHQRRQTELPPQVVEHDDRIIITYYKQGLPQLIVVPKQQPAALNYELYGIEEHIDGSTTATLLPFPQHTLNQASVQLLRYDCIELRSRVGRVVKVFTNDEVPNLIS